MMCGGGRVGRDGDEAVYRSVHTVSLTFDHRNKQSWAFMWVCVMLGHLAQRITPLEVTITKCMQHSKLQVTD